MRIVVQSEPSGASRQRDTPITDNAAALKREPESARSWILYAIDSHTDLGCIFVFWKGIRTKSITRQIRVVYEWG